MPEKGYFVNEANMAELIRIQKQKENLEKQVITLEKLGQIKDQQIDLLQRNVDEQRKARYKEQLWANFSGVAGFTLGVVLSSVAAYATIKTLK